MVFLLRILYLLLGLSCFIGSETRVQAEQRTLTFDPPHLMVSGIPNVVGPQIREQHFIMSRGTADAPELIFLQQSGGRGDPCNGTTYARFISGENNFRVKHEEGRPFTPVQVDLSAGYSGLDLTIEGVKEDGTVVSHTFVNVTYGDGYGPKNDFGSFVFPASFEQIVELRIPGTYYKLDNLVVLPPEQEAPAPVPLPEPYVYKLDWEDSMHVTDQVTATGGQRAPSSLFFGAPKVRQRPSGEGRRLEMNRDDDTYEQIGLSLGMQATRYVLDFDLSHDNGAQASLSLDMSLGILGIDLNNGRLRFSNTSTLLLDGRFENLDYEAARENHFQLIWDEAASLVSLRVNGEQRASWNLANKLEDISWIRFNTANRDVTWIDNIQVQAEGQPSFCFQPTTLDFGQVTALFTYTAPITLWNRSQEPVILTGAELDSPIFSFSGPAFPRVLPAGESISCQVTVAPLTSKGDSVLLGIHAGTTAAMIKLRASGGNSNVNYFSDPPDSQQILVGMPLRLEATFSGPSAVRFEWLKDGVLIPGDGTTLDVSGSAEEQHTGAYLVRAILTNGEVVESPKAQVSVVSPAFLDHPRSDWVRLPPGQMQGVFLYSRFNTTASRYEWTKDGRVVGKDQPTHEFVVAGLQDAGVYQVTAYLADGRSITSLPANIGVLKPVSLSRALGEGGTFSHTMLIAGPSLKFSWNHSSGLTMAELPGIAEAGLTLRLNPLSLQHEGTFTGTALMPNGTREGWFLRSPTTSEVSLQVVPLPVLQTESLGHAMVGLRYDLTLMATSEWPKYFSAQGLPAELKLDPQTGRIQGVLQQSSILPGTPAAGSSSYRVFVSVHTPYGTTTRQMTLQVHRRWLDGGVAGLIQPGLLSGIRQPAKVQGELTGSQMSLQVLGSPRVQGVATLLFDQATGRMRGRMHKASASEWLGHPVRWNGSVLESDVESTSEALVQFHASRVVRQLDPSLHFAGKYPTALTTVDGRAPAAADLPVGSGVLNARLDAKARLTYTGALPDGSSFTGSGELTEDWYNDQALLHPLCCVASPGGGRVLGWVQVAYQALYGQLEWSRPALRTDPSWPQGFAFGTQTRYLQVEGRLLVPPPAGETLLGLHRQPVKLTGRTRSDTLISSRRFTVNSRHLAQALPPSTPAATLAIQPGEGTFSGTLNMGSHLGKPVTGSYRGVLMPGQRRGRGFMLVPDLARYRQSFLNLGITLTPGASAPPSIMPMRSVQIELLPEPAAD